ncbi:uncharacterized protein LOC121373793 [Gigantopelta aegis]|uniref:uncharacterized protein LOC121373793 n=1 Tax=Gigantopelta aegis TaxID=1735272 RepID=UPI001B888465|nr:uncharacterized protein LOC121373793 [Gigantopelta aegis]
MTRISPDYSVNMGYKDTKPSGDLRHARHLRLEGRESGKGKKQAASALLDLSNTENIFETQAEELQPHVDIHSGCIKKIAALRIENQQLYEELGRLQTENAILKQNESRLSFEEQMTSSDQRIQFYTGLQSKALFVWLLSFCFLALPACKVLSPTCVMMCIIMKLRLNLQHQDLAYRFSVSVTTISNILNQGLPKLAEKLSFLIQWPDKDSLIRNMPNVIKITCPKCVSIIDCFEVFIQRPGQLTGRAQTWSNYKHNTIKFLVSITPTGAISYVSRAFGGRTLDKVITQRSGYLDKLEYGDQVLADRGFLIAEDLANRNATLVIPAFTRGKSQLSAREVEQTRKIANVRIHVERAIERLKNCNILSSSTSLYMVPHADSIVTICSALCNLQPKLLS